jgi:lysophospholipase L1-like esterase
VSIGTINTAGVDVNFDAPSATDGQPPVLVTCNPGSGTVFPIGSTTVTCTASDSLSRTASCTFGVTIAKIPQLSRVRFLAFGDSITEGEVTVPGSLFSHEAPVSSRQVIVPAAAYPTVLAKMLQARYLAQAESIVVANYGLGGEKAVNARTRFIAALNNVRPEVVLLMEGVNDIARGEDGAASSAASEVRNMAVEARLRGMRVFIATVPPGRPNLGKTVPDILLLDYANRIRAVAGGEGAVLNDLYLSMRSGVFTYIGGDGLHPNEAGYAKIAQDFFTLIQATLELR